MDERRHNMDGALFVDEERRERTDDRRDDRRVRRAYDDGKADAARRVTQGILDRMDLEATVHVREDDERVVLDLEGPDAGRAIGKKGMTLEALQFLVNKIVNRDPDERRHIVLDSGDYRERHDNGLVSMAKREAKRAISSGRAVTLEPMSARDRRVIHVSLAKFPGVSTRSEGEGMDRRLQIIPVRGERGRDERGPRQGAGRDDRPARSGARRERDGSRGPARALADDRAPARGDDRAPLRADDRAPARQYDDDRAPLRDDDDDDFDYPRDDARSDSLRDDERRVDPRREAPRDDARREAPRDDARREALRDDVRRDYPRDDARRDAPRSSERSVARPRADEPRTTGRDDAPRFDERDRIDRGRGR